MTDKPMREYDVSAERVDAHGSLAFCKEAEILLDTDVDGRLDTINPAELLLASLATCMIKGIERVAPIMHFRLRGNVTLRPADRKLLVEWTDVYSDVVARRDPGIVLLDARPHDMYTGKYDEAYEL